MIKTNTPGVISKCCENKTHRDNQSDEHLT